MRAPTDDPRRCSAHNRAGARCGRWVSPGSSKCHLHGGASTGPRTALGRANTAAARIQHGGSTTLSTYQKALAIAAPELFEEAPGTVPLGDELRFARAKLMSLVKREHDERIDLSGPIFGAVDLIRRVSLAQNEVSPGGDAAGRFEITFNVVGEVPGGVPPDSLVAAAPPPARGGAGGEAGSTGTYRPEDWVPLGQGRA